LRQLGWKITRTGVVELQEAFHDDGEQEHQTTRTTS
jgi:hypothetical protein